MKSRLIALSVLALASVLESQNARAQEAFVVTTPRVVHFAEHPLVLNAVVGFGTPEGNLGAELEYNVDDLLALGAGAGVGPDGPELGAGARFRPIMWERKKRAQAITLGVAFSLAHETNHLIDLGLGPSPPDPQLRQHEIIDIGYWVQADVGYELRAAGGFSLLTALGFAQLINQGAAYCTQDRTQARVACDERALGAAIASGLVPTVTIALSHAIH